MATGSLYCLGIVPARGGSKGLRDKNLRTVGGKSLVRLAIEQARASGAISRVICSTDSDAIAAEAIRAGGDVPFRRPAELATDAAGSVDVAIHAVREIEGQRGRPVDLVCLLQPTSPLRRPDDVARAVRLLLDDPAADSVVSLCPAEHAQPAWLRKIVDGAVQPYFEQFASFARRQDLEDYPTAYRPNGAVYVVRRDVLLDQRTFQGRRCLALPMPPERSIDVDTETDLVCAEALWQYLHDRP